MSIIDREITPQPKGKKAKAKKPYVSKKIRDSAKGEACTLRIPGVCNHNNETVVFAHINTQHKGMGNKSPDIFGVYACSDCHDWLDGRGLKVDPALRKPETLRAFIETLYKLLTKGLLEIK